MVTPFDNTRRDAAIARLQQTLGLTDEEMAAFIHGARAGEFNDLTV